MSIPLIFSTSSKYILFPAEEPIQIAGSSLSYHINKANTNNHPLKPALGKTKPNSPFSGENNFHHGKKSEIPEIICERELEQTATFGSASVW